MMPHLPATMDNTPTPDDPPPVRPVEPDAGDCCGEGCVPCIFDLYEQALDRYKEALAAWRERHPGLDPG
jgi:hypothetical protein